MDIAPRVSPECDAVHRVIDRLVRGAEGGGLPDRTAVVYVSPLKALSNDIHRNLEAPLLGIARELERLGSHDIAIRSGVRTGDTPAAERLCMRRRPPHLLVTTPESLYARSRPSCRTRGGARSTTASPI